MANKKQMKADAAIIRVPLYPVGSLYTQNDLRKVELEVELPCAGILGYISVLVCKGNAQLDHLEQINITAQCLVVIVCRGAKVAYERIRTTRILVSSFVEYAQCYK